MKRKEKDYKNIHENLTRLQAAGKPKTPQTATHLAMQKPKPLALLAVESGLRPCVPIDAEC